jgi:hypothetical protein
MQEIDAPARTKFLSDTEEPIEMSAKMLVLPPMRTLSPMLTLEPRRAKHLNESEDATCTKFRTEIPLPLRRNALNDKLDPRCT